MPPTREQAMAELYRRNAMMPEQKRAYEELMRRGVVTGPLDRSMAQRLWDNAVDGFARSAAGQTNRNVDSNANGADLADIWDTPRIRKGGLIDRALDATLGADRGYLRGTTALTPAEREERIRRERYNARAAADPIRSVDDAGSYLIGQALGAFASPENWIAPGKGVVGRAVGNAAVAGGTDVLLQGNDVMSGVQDEYSAAQTAMAFGLGAVFSLGGDALGRAGQTPPIVRSALTDPVEAVHPGIPGGPRTATSSAALVGATEPVRITERAPTGDGAAAAAVVEPEFGIVQRVDRKTPMMDMLARFRSGEGMQVVGEGLARAYTATVAEAHPLVRVVEDLRGKTEAITGKAVDLKPSEDPRLLQRGRFDWAAIGHTDLTQGVHPYHGVDPASPALADVIAAVSERAKRTGEKPADALQRLNEYMVARRVSQEWERHARGELEAAPASRSKAEADAFIAHINLQHPEFAALSDQVNAFAGALLKKRLDGGLIDKATYAASLANRDFYVPLRRVMDDALTVSGPGAKNAGGEIKAFKGSARDVVDPMSVLIQQTYKLNSRLRQNDLNVSLVQLAERLDALLPEGESNGWLRKVEVPAEKIDLSKLDLGDDGPEEMWRAGDINDAGKAILYVWRDGKREAWEVIDQEWGRDVYQAMAGMPPGMSDAFVNMLSVPTAFLAQTITRDPAFMFTNFIRDQVSSWLVTDVGFKPGEGLVGVAEELKQGEASRLYGASGGISGGAVTATLGEALHQADTLALAKSGWKAKYASSLSGLLQIPEITETGTRLRVFKRGFERAKKAGFSEYDALLQASFTARDMMDFGRTGSRLHQTRRLVTFLNAYVQSMDKMVRTLVADPAGAMGRIHAQGGNEAVIKTVLSPLFRDGAGVSVRAEDKAALKLAMKAWTKLSALAVFSLGLRALYAGDPAFEQANERTRATNWVIPWGDNMVKVPKPFEYALLSNIAERAFEATIGRDSSAWGRMVRGMGMLVLPPDDAPIGAVVGGLASNTNSQTGRPIVPEHELSKPPDLQFQYWNSRFSRWLGRQINVSPAKIDYTIQGFAGPYGSYLLNGMDAADPDRPSGSWTDLPVVRRFVQPWARGAQDQRDFYDRAGAKTSELKQTLEGVKADTEAGRHASAADRLSRLDEPGRLYVLSQLGAAPTRWLNPLSRAEAVAQEASGLIGEMNGAQPKDDGVALPRMSRKTRQAVEDAVERVTVAEMRNAMITTRQPGFENRQMMDREGYWEDLRDLSPEVARELERRLGSGRNRAYDYDALQRMWPQVEQRLRAGGSSAYLDDLAAGAEGATRSWGEKVDDGGEPVGPALRF